ncbi:hypothetical protein RUND412_001517 [Rhizina undulata]
MAFDVPIADEGHRIVSIATGFMAAITLVMIGRLSVRVTMLGFVGEDDWIMLLATCTSISMSAVSIVEVQYGGGKHMQDMPPAEFRHGMMLNFINQIIYVIAMALVKISICFFILRLAPTKTYRRLCCATMIFTGLYTILRLIAITLQCQPIAHFWDRSIEGKCVNSSMLIRMADAYSALVIFTDFLLIVFPVPMFWNLKLPGRQKEIICFIMKLGVLASTASIVRMTYNKNYGKIGGDFLWSSTSLTIWSIIEVDIGIITASMPALKPFFKSFIEKTVYSRGSRLSLLHPDQSDSLNAPRVTNDIYANSKHLTDETFNDSEEINFPQAAKMGGITKMTEVRLDVEHLGDEHGLEKRDFSKKFPG